MRAWIGAYKSRSRVGSAAHRPGPALVNCLAVSYLDAQFWFGRRSTILHHRTTIDVRFYELDPYNHLNHTMYLAYCEVARVQALESVGIGLTTLDERGFRIVVSDITAKFLIPVVGGDRLSVVTEVVSVGRATHQWQQRIERGTAVLFTLEVRAAMTDSDGKPVRVPDFVREVLEATTGDAVSDEPEIA